MGAPLSVLNTGSDKCFIAHHFRISTCVQHFVSIPFYPITVVGIGDTIDEFATIPSTLSCFQQLYIVELTKSILFTNAIYA